MEYGTLFSKRATTYLHALKTYPAVLANEFRAAVEKCQLQQDDTLLLIPCSCEHIQPWLPSTVKCIEYETNAELAAATDKPYCQFSAVPLPNASVTRILSLATLHHLTTEERAAFYKEAMRLLKPDGKLILGDVIQGSPQDRWLNLFVDTFNSYGHKGRFFTEADAALLESAGFQVDIQHAEYTWDFKSQEEMVVFCRNLFHLDRATDADIKEGLQTHFDISNNTLQWKLIYFICTKL
jgi:SAM-dependent methyltransferase